jgi:TPP-dependent pyruvate/acetoin dehydrogenase alpha subunit
MPIDLWSLYVLMKKSRLFEEAVTQLWKDGLISGEMHLGTGEEAIIAGVVSQIAPWRCHGRGSSRQRSLFNAWR